MTIDTTATPTKSSSAAASASTPTSSQTNASTNVTPTLQSQQQQQQQSTPNVIKKSRNEVIRTIQEITKFDEFTINQAIEACQDSEGRYSMDTVLNILMDEKYSNEQSQDPNRVRFNRQYGTSPSSSSSNNDENNKYLSPLSKGTHHQPSSQDRNTDLFANNIDDDDDEDYEALINCSSNAQNSLNSQQRTGANVFLESNVIREEGKPSGLKNIGNTCWFNSIIQAFFHLPYFRKLILSFKLEPCEMEKLDENSKNVVQFVAELRKLFALMLKSKRKSINPSLTLRCLRNCSKYDVDTFNQEDVSEFSTILVNLLEESFDIMFKVQQKQQQTASTQSQEGEEHVTTSTSDDTADVKKPGGIDSDKLNLRKNRKNPIVNLLNGDILINRKNSDEDKTNSLVEIFREINIQMLNSRSLHAGLELEWGETSIDKLCTTSTSEAKSSAIKSSGGVSSNEECLNRSFYEQESWIVKLPSVLFICLNRYKFIKATQSSSKILEPFEFYPHVYLDRYLHVNRDAIKEKRKQLKLLNNQLNQLELKLKSINEYKYSGDNEKKYPLDEVLKCALHFATNDFTLDDVFNKIKPLNVQNTEATSVDERHTINVVEKCLKSWLEQIETKMSELNRNISDLKQRIKTIFDDESLKNVRYDLHSVCIHEGNANSGHFWTYIWKPSVNKWFKFNDTEVCESNWDDLYANAVGGNSNSSSTSSSTSCSTSKIEETVIVEKPNDLSSNNVKATNTSTSSHKQSHDQHQHQHQLVDENPIKSSDRIPSAYFLIYAKSGDETLYQENNDLDSDLVKLLKDDQETFETQLNHLKLKQIYRDSMENLKKSNLLIANATQNSSATIAANEQNNQTCMEHAKAFTESTLEALTVSFDRINLTPNKNSPNLSGLDYTAADEALKYAVQHELNKYTDSSKEVLNQLPMNDLRINHILVYLNCNNVSRDLKVLALYDIFRMQIFSDNNIRMKILQTVAQLKYNEHLLASLNQTGSTTGAPVSSPATTTSFPSTSNTSSQAQTNLFKLYEKCLADYRDYRSIIAAFINAGNFMESLRFEEAAPFFCVACEYNERITSYLKDKMKGMDHEFLLANRRKCLKLWNHMAIKKFTHKGSTGSTSSRTASNVEALTSNFQNLQLQQPLTQQELNSLIETMINKFLPCFFRLLTSTSEDKAMIDEIRQEWLNILDANLPEIQIFHDFMTKLFEEPLVNHYHSLNVNKTNLLNRYKEVALIVQNIKI